ncbi:hypothetical protein F5B20DRAFT_583447 [Whalleya microplaca]|nr:hypothetical protein F5B20DRAFT_583447 [Whalleya microplaca]
MARTLTSLPPEVLHLIIEYFDPKPIGIGARRPISLHYRRQCKKREVLGNLCLASQQLNRIATSILYRHLTVETAVQCASLFYTLLCTPPLRRYGRSFCCLASLGYDDDREARHRFDQCLEDNPSSPLQLDARAKEVLPRVRMSYGDQSGLVYPSIDRFSEASVAGISLLLPCLEDILVELPQFHGDYFMYQIRNLDVWENAFGGNEPSWGSALGSLRSLRLQGDPKITDRQSDVRDTGILPSLVPQIFEAPNLKQIEFHGDRGDLRSFRSDEDNRGFDLAERKVSIRGQVEELGLYHSQAHPSMVYQLLKCFTNLKSLSWTFRQEAWRPIAGVTDYSMDEALEQTSKSLRRLRLECLTVSCVYDYYWDPDLIIHFELFDTVKRLSNFPNIENLTIDLMSLAGPYHLQHIRNPVFDLSAALPPNLVRLELIEKSLDDIYVQYGIEYRRHDEWLGCVLQSFAKACVTEKPRLREFVFRGFKYSRIRERSRPHIAFLSKCFKQAGVDFFWQWEPADRVSSQTGDGVDDSHWYI